MICLDVQFDSIRTFKSQAWGFVQVASSSCDCSLDSDQGESAESENVC